MWMATLAICTFLINPMMNGAVNMWMLVAMPLVGLSINKNNINYCISGCIAVVAIYSAGLILQLLLRVHYNEDSFLTVPAFRPGTYAYAWPLVDPNNAACILNFALIPCFYLALRKKIWWIITVFLMFSMFATASKSGGLAALAACMVLLAEYIGSVLTFACFVVVSIIPLTLLFKTYGASAGLAERPEMWKTCLHMISLHPWVGTGMGTFAAYYSVYRTEHTTGGYFAHNDLLQLAIEIGVPAAMALVALIISIAATISRRNIVAAVTMAAVFLQAMVEFEFYLPSISILSGLALAYHRLTYCDKRNIMLGRR